jgi:four helix bundle protein
MSKDPLENFDAHRLAMELFDLVVEDMATIAKKRTMEKLISQQLGSADSIAANIEEGFGRETTKEYIRFLVIARGSARETCGRYKRLRHWYKEDLIEERVARCNHIIASLTKTIGTLKRKGSR